MQPYRLIQSIYAHDGPIRSIAIGPTENEIVTGSQADAPYIRRWRLSKDLMQVEEIGSPIFHDHWVTALTALKPSNSLPPLLQNGCIISGCMDKKIRLFDLDHNLLATLEGHSKGVISFSWLGSHQLISGGWDGLAILWDLITLQQVRSFGPHENGVHVLGLSNGLIATTSTGESVNSQPANFQLRIWNPTTGQLVGAPIKDHLGSIRSIAALPGFDGFLTSSNDGSVIVRSIDGQVIETLMHPFQDDGAPPFVLDCSALDTDGGMDLVSSGEDGSVVVWQGTELLQSIPHPNTVWIALGLKSDSHTGEFLTGGQDGILRVFSKQDSYKDNTTVGQLVDDFLTEVNIAKQAKRSGPSAEDLAKAAKWENRGQIPGKSEHQIMVFNRDGSLIAAEWTNGSWIFVGEVQGQNNSGNSITANDSGSINGQFYDHIFPVEIETPQGLKALQLGFNNLENPFVAAQRFIDQNGLGQYYLQQIADWIIARGGGGGSSSAQSAGSNQVRQQQSQSFGTTQTSQAPVSTPTFAPKYKLTYYVDGFAVFNDIPNMSKVLTKLKELNDGLTDAPEVQISEVQFVQLEKLLTTLENTSFYHSSKINSEELITLTTFSLKWSQSPRTINNVFIFFDIMRLFVLHPYCLELFHQPKHLPSLLQYFQAVDSILTLIQTSNYSTAVVSHNVLSTMIRSLNNFLKNEILVTSIILAKEGAITAQIRQLFTHVIVKLNHSFYFTYSLHKFTRLSIVTLFHNLVNSLFINKQITYVAWFTALNNVTSPAQFFQLVQNLLQVITTEKETLLVVFRAFQIVNTIVQYTAAIPTYPSIDPIIALIRSNDGRLHLMNAVNYWKGKENSKEVVQSFEELIAL